MTFSSASISARDVDDVAATAAGVTGLRAGVGAATLWRAAGAGAAGTDIVVGGLSLAAAVAAGGGVVFGTTLRAIGLDLGSGTFAGDVAASAAGIDKPSASARPVARVVDRNAAARIKGATAFLRGESFSGFNASCI
jgi:hypothetical protein